MGKMEWLRRVFKRSDTSSSAPEHDETLESAEEYRQRWYSVRVIYFTMFLMSLGFSIILTGIWPYLNKLDPQAGKDFMGYIVGANPFGQMLFSPLFGWWSNKLSSIRVPLLISLAIFTTASAVYSSIEILPSHHKYWMLFSRFFVGVSSSNIAVCRSYLSAATRLKERTGAVAMVSLAQVLGFVVGPAIQAAVTQLGEHGLIIPGVFHLNMYTAAGWINVLLGIGNFCMFLPTFFKERRIAAKEVMILQGKGDERETWKSIKPDYFSAWTLIVAFFILVFNFVLLETLGTSLTMDQFAWSKMEALSYMGILMSVGAVIACVTFVAINPLCKRFDERKVLLWGGFFFMVLGRALYIPWGSAPPIIAEMGNGTVSDTEILGCPSTQEWCRTTPAMTIMQFLLGYITTSIGYPIGVTLIQTIFSKILGPRPQGTWMGLMTGSGCLSRVLGPVFVGYIYTRLGTFWTFGVTTVMMAVAMIWLCLFSNRLVPPELDHPAPAAVELHEMSMVKLASRESLDHELEALRKPEKVEDR
ncbi:major facilitator superfamily domain-containing protein 8 [Phlebotomus argentipes]|uniref:major facilitator superfamily domain-containing protein 8 n=1 Tax=Phlebotomus argentipes TaxID=94469 RepID=UPI0028933D8C|nr:major facilitator superfamily domain-containing protein 8 [Phlebotomus argentipes]XP_059622359.1 major facilitator superfamily domain-containing protein 8 [Phlebotomus argentipes]